MKVVLQNLTKKFPGRGRKNPVEVTAVNDFTFEIRTESWSGFWGLPAVGRVPPSI
jgi:multiple sugar transport system ATP-binding protein